MLNLRRLPTHPGYAHFKLVTVAGVRRREIPQTEVHERPHGERRVAPLWPGGRRSSRAAWRPADPIARAGQSRMSTAHRDGDAGGVLGGPAPFPSPESHERAGMTEPVWRIARPPTAGNRERTRILARASIPLDLLAFGHLVTAAYHRQAQARRILPRSMDDLAAELLVVVFCRPKEPDRRLLRQALCPHWPIRA